jgi:hypothetical protein
MDFSNINTMYTVTKYRHSAHNGCSVNVHKLLLCIVVTLSNGTAYYCNSVVYTSKDRVEDYEYTSDDLSLLGLRLKIAMYFGQVRGYVLTFIFILVPLCLMIRLLIYVNRNNALPLALSTICILLTTLGSLILYMVDFL